MVTWEYARVELLSGETESWMAELERLGREGWELVERTHGSDGALALLLKRAIEPKATESTIHPQGHAALVGGATSVGAPTDWSPNPSREPDRDVGLRRYHGVVRDVLASIADGSLRAGSRLPNERTLSELCGASCATVREALVALELLGVVEVRPGSGTYVSANSRHGGSSTFLHFDAPPRMLIEAHEQIEPAVAGLSATRVAAADVARLNHLLDECDLEARRAAPDAPETFLQLSLQFHSELADLCGNEILSKLTKQLVDVTAHPLWMVVNGMYVRTQESRRDQIAEHRSVLAAVAARDSDGAALAMSAHLGGLSTGVFGRRGGPHGVVAQPWRRGPVV